MEYLIKKLEKLNKQLDLSILLQNKKKIEILQNQILMIEENIKIRKEVRAESQK